MTGMMWIAVHNSMVTIGKNEERMVDEGMITRCSLWDERRCSAVKIVQYIAWGRKLRC